MPALVCGSLAFDSIATFPGRFADQILAEPAARPERLVPGADAAARIRRLRRQHRLQPGRARRRARGPRRGRQRRRRVPGATALVGHDHRARPAGRRQPSRRRRSSSPTSTTTRSPRSTPARCSRRTKRRCRRAATCASRSSLPTAARRCSSTRSSSRRRRSRSSSIRARACRCSTAPSCSAFVERASWVAVNDYEAQMLADRTGRSIEAMSRSHLRGIVVTLGAQGCEVWQQGVKTTVPGVAATEVVDPTGCGDAFRAAMLYGLERGWPLDRLRPPGQPPRRAQDRQPRRPESCAGSHVCRCLTGRPLKFTDRPPKSPSWTFVKVAR